jgi:drug/metabolite transporter (DMT)-like permease
MKNKTLTAAVLSVVLYFVVLFCNKYTTVIQAFFINNLAPVFALFSLLLPILFLLLSEKNNGGRYEMNKKTSGTIGGKK